MAPPTRRTPDPMRAGVLCVEGLCGRQTHGLIKSVGRDPGGQLHREQASRTCWLYGRNHGTDDAEEGAESTRDTGQTPSRIT